MASGVQHGVRATKTAKARGGGGGTGGGGARGGSRGGGGRRPGRDGARGAVRGRADAARRAVVVAADGTVLARTGNTMRRANDPTAHAEMLALREACATLGTDRLPDCDLYVTLEPCTMCAGAISHARIRRRYYGASDR